MIARTMMSGFRPHHFPRLVNVCPAWLLRSMVALLGEPRDRKLGLDEAQAGRCRSGLRSSVTGRMVGAPRPNRERFRRLA